MRAAQLLALAAAAFLLVGLLGAQAARPGLNLVAATALAIAGGIGFIAISVVLVGLIVRLPLSWKAQLGLVVLCGLVSAGAKIAKVSLVGDLFLFAAAIFFGILVSRVIKERNMIVPVAVAAAAVDTYGVYWGFVSIMARKAPEVVRHLTAAVPGATAEVPVQLLGAIGIGDFLFMGIFVAAVYRLGMNRRGTLWALFAVFLTVPVVFGLLRLAALPGLPFLGLAVVGANWRYFHFSRAEKFALLYAALAVAGIIGLAWWITRVLS